jgi:hypothetical protein
MSKGIISGLIITLVVLTIILNSGYSQDVRFQPVRIMFYNVENLFDIYNDTLKDDDDFLPDGVMRWNFTRYNKKINSLYKTIVAAGEWNPPAVVAFCEVGKYWKTLFTALFLRNITIELSMRNLPIREVLMYA